jgi:membrane protein DedA with SNARE-associated domain
MTALLEHGSILLVLAWLAIGGLGAPLPEDAALLAAGVLVERGAVHPAVAIAVVALGVLGGDAMLFFAARKLGPAAYKRKLIQRALPPARRAKIERAYARYGGRLVFVARFVAGIRAGTFALAGIHGMQPRRFLLWDGLAACISIPLVMGLGYFGAAHLDEVRAALAAARLWLLAALVIAVVVGAIWYRVSSRSRRAARPAMRARRIARTRRTRGGSRSRCCRA